ncbi:SapB/AmfS family lanthipeptide [Streptomyces sp. RB6PN25]|uniref:SapB/AmfS family lanthipeptide n=1 Tax=Streptomyces humicola TaxID=2953240 RepID=A0ABT1PWU1_9ACTN|nr:SapB/AmfS family lanthipeptide [Streptomyces humicola]MCQ4082131.1 SapB/AmfS family lanthipeptide [Streptomyces humicola]
MSLLDLQTLETAEPAEAGENWESGLSLLLCDSLASVTLCV